MLSIFCSLMLASIGAQPVAAADTVVVCPALFHTALRPWIEHRQAQGHAVALVAAEEDPHTIKARLRAAYLAEPKLAILLVGDADPASPFDAPTRARSVPTHMATATINVLFGSEPQIATDNWYADFDDDGVPEASIGRLPVDTPTELTSLIKRIIAYEHSSDFGLWRRKINFVAGLGGFGPVADAALESAAKTLLTNYLPPAIDSSMTYSSWQSPYFPGAPHFRTAAVDRFNEGCLMWVYIGHGARREVDRFLAPDGAVYQILSARDTGALRAQRQPPMALFLSCYSGAFDAPEDCLAEEMLRSEGGPIAVMSGSRVTMPYAMSILGQELMAGFFQTKPTTIGELFRDAKRALALRPRTSDADKQFDALATAMMPMAADLKAQRLEHLQLFNLLGDPLLRVRHALDAKVETPTEARAGTTITVRGETPIGGATLVELVVRRDRFTFTLPERERYDLTSTGLAEYSDTYARANDTRIYSEQRSLPAGPFELTLPVPPEARGDCHVRVYVASADAYAVGSANIKVRAAAKPK